MTASSREITEATAEKAGPQKSMATVKRKRVTVERAVMGTNWRPPGALEMAVREVRRECEEMAMLRVATVQTRERPAAAALTIPAVMAAEEGLLVVESWTEPGTPWAVKVGMVAMAARQVLEPAASAVAEAPAPTPRWEPVGLPPAVTVGTEAQGLPPTKDREAAEAIPAKEVTRVVHPAQRWTRANPASLVVVEMASEIGMGSLVRTFATAAPFRPVGRLLPTSRIAIISRASAESGRANKRRENLDRAIASSARRKSNPAGLPARNRAGRM